MQRPPPHSVRVASVEPGLSETEFSLVRFSGDAARAARVYEGKRVLVADDVTEAIHWVASMSPHVNVNVVEMMPTAQSFRCPTRGAEFMSSRAVAGRLHSQHGPGFVVSAHEDDHPRSPGEAGPATRISSFTIADRRPGFAVRGRIRRAIFIAIPPTPGWSCFRDSRGARDRLRT